MKSDQILLSDLPRIFFGQTPPTFLAEVAVRAVLFFSIIIITMRLLGRRVASQYTLIELSAVITLAGTIGVPLLDEKRGLLPPLIIIAGVIGVQHLAALTGMRSRKADQLMAGRPVVAVSDGQLHLDVLKSTVLSREKLFSLLRLRGVQQLGQLSRVYIEPSGALTLVWSDTPRPGLAIIPEQEQALHEAMRAKREVVCSACGRLEQSESAAEQPCRGCRAQRWQPAAVSLEE